MTERNYSGIDDLQTELLGRGGVELICQFYGIDQGELLRRSSEIRSACFLSCGKSDETGNRAISFDTTKPRWHCYEYGCGKGGNLVTLCGYARFGTELATPVRGSQFKAVRDDIREMLGETPAPQPDAHETDTPDDTKLPVNTPLKDSPIAAARKLVDLHEQCRVVPDDSMNRYAAAYLRSRPFLTPEACASWQCGALPHNARTLLRGKFIYPLLDEQGDVLTWFGRDPQFEAKQQKWIRDGRPSQREPNKYQFVKGFHKGLELFGQHRLVSDEVRRKLVDLDVLPVVEGPNDVIALEHLGVPSLGVCGNRVTTEQARKLAGYARRLGVPIGLMFDNDAEGESGAKQSLPILAEHWPVRLIWSASTCGGQFRGWQPEQLAAVPEMWDTVYGRLTTPIQP